MGGTCTELRGYEKCLQRLITKTESQRPICKHRRRYDEKVKINSKGMRRDEIGDLPAPPSVLVSGCRDQRSGSPDTVKCRKCL